MVRRVSKCACVQKDYCTQEWRDIPFSNIDFPIKRVEWNCMLISLLADLQCFSKCEQALICQSLVDKIDNMRELCNCSTDYNSEMVLPEYTYKISKRKTKNQRKGKRTRKATAATNITACHYKTYIKNLIKNLLGCNEIQETKETKKLFTKTWLNDLSNLYATVTGTPVTHCQAPENEIEQMRNACVADLQQNTKNMCKKALSSRTSTCKCMQQPTYCHSSEQKRSGHYKQQHTIAKCLTADAKWYGTYSDVTSTEAKHSCSSTNMSCATSLTTIKDSKSESKNSSYANLKLQHAPPKCKMANAHNTNNKKFFARYKNSSSAKSSKQDIKHKKELSETQKVMKYIKLGFYEGFDCSMRHENNAASSTSSDSKIESSVASSYKRLTFSTSYSFSSSDDETQNNNNNNNNTKSSFSLRFKDSKGLKKESAI